MIFEIRADSKIHISFDDIELGGEEPFGESVWAKVLEENVYLILNEPLHPKYRWGDVVKTASLDGRAVVTEHLVPKTEDR